MKALFTCQPAFGHVHPLIPLGRQLAADGHEVAFACAPSFCPTVDAYGVRALPAGLDWLESEAERTFPALRGMPLAEQASYFVTDIFAGAVARAMVPDLIALGRRWRPDVLVTEAWEFDGADGASLPAWVADLPARPTVYATLGTVFNKTPGVFEALLDGLRDEPINLVLTIGRDRDPAELGPQPGNVRIERYVPQSLLLDHCDVVISHGGYNTVMAALEHGLPLLLLPLSADQGFHARRCNELGFGRALGLAEFGRLLGLPAVEGTTLRDSVMALIEEPAYRAGAQRLQQEMRSLPGVERGAELLVQLAREKRPIVATGH